MPPTTPPPAAGSRAPAGLSRVPKAYLIGGAAAGVAGLALWMRKRSAKNNGQTTSSSTTSPQDLAEATYDSSVYDSYNDLQSEYQSLANQVQGLSQQPTPGNTNPNPSPVPTPTPPPTLQGGNPPRGGGPVPVKPGPPPSPGPAPKPKPPKPGPRPNRTQVVGKWPNWDGSLFGIAQHYYGNGNQWPKIYAANRSVIGGNPNKIRPGMKLTIPN